MMLWKSSCSACLKRRFSTSAIPISKPSSLRGVANCFALLKRSVIKVEGTDAGSFLQSLTTNNIKLLYLLTYFLCVNCLIYPEHAAHQPDAPRALFTGFLNAQGRVVYEGFMLSGLEPQSFFVDCDITVGEELLKHLKRYKIRY